MSFITGTETAGFIRYAADRQIWAVIGIIEELLIPQFGCLRLPIFLSFRHGTVVSFMASRFARTCK